MSWDCGRMSRIRSTTCSPAAAFFGTARPISSVSLRRPPRIFCGCAARSGPSAILITTCEVRFTELMETWHMAALPVIDLTGGWEQVLEGRARTVLEQEILPPFLQRQRWFGGKARRLEGVCI